MSKFILRPPHPMSRPPPPIFLGALTRAACASPPAEHARLSDTLETLEWGRGCGVKPTVSPFFYYYCYSYARDNSIVLEQRVFVAVEDTR